MRVAPLPNPDRGKEREKKSEPGVKEICGQTPARRLTVGPFGRAQERFRSFLSGLAWHRPQSQSCPRHNGSYSGREREREGVCMCVCVCAGEAWCLSLPWSPMALLTIQHPPNYPPIHSQRDKARALVCWNNMATNLSHSNITPTPLSLEVRCAPQSPPQTPTPLYFLFDEPPNLSRSSLFRFVRARVAVFLFSM